MKLLWKLNRKTLCACGLAILLAGCRLPAQNITGDWQGTITPPQGKPLRMVLQVIHDDGGALKARIYSIPIIMFSTPTKPRSYAP